MSRLLAELLGIHETKLRADLERLESAGGLPSHDVRLTSEIIGKVQLQVKALGLDPTDSTGHEIYAALLGMAAHHDKLLAAKIGAKDPEDVHDLLPRIRKVALKLSPQKAWVIKHSAAKKLFKKYPPKHAMKLLGYKSLDSMLKRVNVSELFIAMRLVETPAWIETFVASYQTLSPTDFELRPVEVVLVAAKKWQKAAEGFIQKHRHIMLQVRESGVIALLPPPFERQRGFTITVLPQLLEAMNEIRLQTIFYKLHQMHPNLGQIMADSLLRDSGHHFDLAGQQAHWRVIQRHFAQSGRHPEVFEPHIQPEDLSWQKVEQSLTKLVPALQFWVDMDFVGMMVDGRPISFNLADTSLNYLNNMPYEHRLVHHLQQSLWHEILVRYAGQESLERSLLEQLDYDSIELTLETKRSR